MMTCGRQTPDAAGSGEGWPGLDRRASWRLPAQRAASGRCGAGSYHQLHQHVQPVGDAGGGPAGEEGGGSRADVQALRQDEPGPRVEGGDGVPQGGGAAGAAGEVGVPPGGWVAVRFLADNPGLLIFLKSF